MAHPIKYNPADLVPEIVARLSTGETLRSICRDEHMPNYTIVYGWMDADADIAQRIARARELGADAIAESILEIADDARNDYMESQDDQGGVAYKLNGEHIQRSKLRAEMRLKLLAKWQPKKYGDKLELDNKHSGSVQVEAISVSIVDPKSK